MSIKAPPALDGDTEALMERIVQGTPLPADVYQRIRQRGDKLRDEMRQKYGDVELAVDLIRGIRDEG